MIPFSASTESTWIRESIYIKQNIENWAQRRFHDQLNLVFPKDGGAVATLTFDALGTSPSDSCSLGITVEMEVVTIKGTSLLLKKIDIQSPSTTKEVNVEWET